MILEDRLKEFSYARLIVADYHLEYPLNASQGGTAHVFWNPFELGDIVAQLMGVNEADISTIREHLFKVLESRYNGYWDSDMNLWILQGSIPQLCSIFHDLAAQLAFGSSGDDDTFDYWPNACDMLCVLATDLLDLIEYHSLQGYYHDRILTGLMVVTAGATAANGDPNEWDAEGHFDAMNSILVKYRKED